MGWFFSNLHVRKTAEYDADFFRSTLTEILNAKGYVKKNSPDEADLSLSIYDAGGKWVSVCSDGLEFYTEESIRDICNPLSESLSADVLTVSCFDSDCLILNRVNKKLDVVAWAKTGSYPELKIRSTPARWKDIVTDIAQWKSVLTQKYDFAEDALDGLEPLLGLTSGQGRFCDELITEQFTEGVQTLYFNLPESASKSEPPKLSFTSPSLMPCEIGKDQCYFVINTGGKTKGVAIAFSGNYVEQEKIRFRDVQLEYDLDRYPRKTIPIQLEKRQMQNGQWIYYAELRDFPIREGVKEGLSWKRKSEEEWKRQFGVRFTPEGDPRKLLDITVHFIPLKNPEGQCGWCAWRWYGSKRAYIEKHNRTWGEIVEEHHAQGIKLLNPDDYDLDE